MARLEQKVDDGFSQLRDEMRGLHKDLKLIGARLDQQDTRIAAQDTRFITKSSVTWLIGTLIAAATAVSAWIGAHR